MHIPVVDILVSLFFLGTLAVTARFYRRAAANLKESLRNIMLGLSLLSLVAILELSKSLGYLGELHLLSEPLVYQLLIWIGMITGIVCVALGISRRLSKSEEGASSRGEYSRRWEALKQIEQLSLVEHRTPILLQKTLQFLVEGFECEHGALYLRSRNGGGMLFVRSEGAGAYAERAYHRIEFDVRPEEVEVAGIRATEADHADMPTGMRAPDGVVPVVTERGIAAAFLLWKKEEIHWRSEDMQTMKLAASITGRIVEVERLNIKQRFMLEREGWHAQTASLLSRQLPLKDQAPMLFEHFRSQIPLDLLSISVVSPQRLLRRVSVSETGGVLDEHRINLHRERSHVPEVIKRDTTMLVLNAHGDPLLPTDDFLIRNAVGSVISMPVTCCDGYQCVVTLAAARTDRFSQKHVSLLQALTPLLREMIANELNREKEISYHNRILLVSELLQNVAANKPVELVIEQVGATLARVAEASIVRIAMLDIDGVTLHSRFLTCSHATHVSTPADGMMVLSLMPNHYRLVSGEVTDPVYCSSEQLEIAESEAILAFAPGVKQMLLLPIRANGRVLGIVGCADMRGKSRTEYTPTDIALLQTLTGVIGTVAHRRMASDVLYSASADMTSLSNPVAGIRPAVRSSLSGIVGSLEMLQAAPAAQDNDVQRYLSIIGRSAQRLSRVLDDEKTSVTRS